MRRAFFSFHFQRDSFKVGQIRNSWVGNAAFEGQPFLDKAAWETIERQGQGAVQRWIDTQMNGTSVTVVLIGAETLSRRWVRYEIGKTLDRGAGLMGIALRGMKDISGQIDTTYASLAGTAFEPRGLSGSPAYPIYNWVADGGRQNLGLWIERAASAAGR